MKLISLITEFKISLVYILDPNEFIRENLIDNLSYTLITYGICLKAFLDSPAV